MNTCTFLKDLLRLIPVTTEMIVLDEEYNKLYQGKNFKGINIYANKIVLQLDVWDAVTLVVRIINDVD